MISYILNFLRNQRHKMQLRSCIKAGLQIGKNISIMDRPNFGNEPYLVRIGNDVSIGTGTKFFTHEGGTRVFRNLPGYKGLHKYDTIEIKDNCAIGADVIILGGVTIGPNAIVGANSVVTKSVPPNTVVVGCPARYVCTYEEYVQKTLPKCRRYPLDALNNPKKMRSLILAALKAERGEDIFHLPEQDATGQKGPET